MFTVPFSIAVKKNPGNWLRFGEITGMEDEISTVCEETLSEIFIETTISNLYIYP